MHPVIAYLLAAVLFGLGCHGVLTRRNAVLVLMAVELMLNAVNLVLITADATVSAALPAAGQSFALFVIVLAAAEVGVGLALILAFHRMRAGVALDEIPLTEPASIDDPTPTDDPTPSDESPSTTGSPSTTEPTTGAAAGSAARSGGVPRAEATAAPELTATDGEAR